MGKIVEAWPTNGRLRMSTCPWELETHYEDEYWVTRCENTFMFSAGGPEENGFEHCPYCGKRIQVIEQNEVVYDIEDGYILGVKEDGTDST